jgi:hypothetical protein
MFHGKLLWDKCPLACQRNEKARSVPLQIAGFLPLDQVLLPLQLGWPAQSRAGNREIDSISAMVIATRRHQPSPKSGR